MEQQTIRKRKRYGRGHILHFCLGHDFFGGGFGREITPEIEHEMRDVWPALRKHVFRLARQRAIQRNFKSLPAFWWKYESPVARNKTMSESEQLEKMGLNIDDVLNEK